MLDRISNNVMSQFVQCDNGDKLCLKNPYKTKIPITSFEMSPTRNRKLQKKSLQFNLQNI